MSKRKKVLYISHGSLVDPIPRLHGLDQIHALSGERKISILSIEPKRGEREENEHEVYEKTRSWLRKAGIEHVRLPALGSRWREIPLGAMLALRQILFHQVRILHCRSYVPAIMGLLAQIVTPTRLLFDMRGLFIDEYLFYGALREGTWKLRFARWLERKLLFHSDATIVVSQRFRDHLLARTDLAGTIDPEKIYLIPNRVDLSRFKDLARERERLRAEWGWEGKTVAVYTGSTAPWHRFDRTVEILGRVMSRMDDVRFLAIAYPDTEQVRSLARGAAIPDECSRFLTARVEQIPSLLAAGDFSIMLDERHIARHVCAPIKFSEYLAAGLPVVGGGSIGDMADWIDREDIGILVDPDETEDAAQKIREYLQSDDFRAGGARKRCVEFAAREMNMEKTLAEYMRIYRILDGR